MICNTIPFGRVVAKRYEKDLNLRKSLIYSLADKYQEDTEYINQLLTFFSGDPFGLPTGEQKERVEKHLQNKAEVPYCKRTNRNRYGNLILITGRSNGNG